MTLKREYISSKQNPKIKNLILLQKSNERKKQNIFLIEGEKEIEKAINTGYELEALYYCTEIISEENISRLFKKKLPTQLFEVSKDVFDKIAYRQDSGGMVLTARPQAHIFSSLSLSDNPLILVLEGVEKPGNIGAIYRTADAAGVTAVIICDQGTDLYNPNAIRASLGCVFTVPTVICTGQEAVHWLQQQNITIYASYLKAADHYHKADFTKPSAIVMGTEATGISDLWVEASYKNIIIPMKGQADSMNVSTATAVLVFEACRQRNFV